MSNASTPENSSSRAIQGRCRLMVAGVLLIVSALSCAGATFTFTTVAGIPGAQAAVDGFPTVARFMGPTQVGLDAAGNIYVADKSTIRRVDKSGNVTTLAGKSEDAASRDGTGTGARFRFITGFAVAADGTMYVTEQGNHAIRKVSPAGVVTTFCGQPNSAGSLDGVGLSAQFASPIGLALDRKGNLYVADYGNGLVRKIAPGGVVTTLAGHVGPVMPQDGRGPAAAFGEVAVIAAGPAGEVYVYDWGVIRKVTADGEVTTFSSIRDGGARFVRDGPAGLARFDGVGGIVVDADGTLFVSEFFNHVIRRISRLGEVTTIAGQVRRSGSADGLGGTARFLAPTGLAIDSDGDLYVADRSNFTIRKGRPSSLASVPIFTEPDSAQHTDAAVGERVELSVAATSELPLTYQWSRDGAAIAGATSATLVLPRAVAGDTGAYAVVASNAAGAESRDWGTVTVYPPPFSSMITRHARTGGAFLWGITSGNGTLVAVGGGGTILVSRDGATWSRAKSGSTEWLLGVAYGAGQFVAVGDHGTILRSADAANWVRVENSGTTQRLNNLTFGLGRFVAVGEHGAIVTSTDGEHWTPRVSGVDGWLRAVACNPAFSDPLNPASKLPVFPRFVAMGEGGAMMTSPDGLVWSRGQSLGQQQIEALVPTASGFIGVGADGATAVGTAHLGGRTILDGVYWESGVTKSSGELRGVAVGANSLFATGENGLVIASPLSGIAWSPIETGTHSNLVAAVYAGNSLYVVGENETILQSAPISGSRLLNISTLGFAGRDGAAMVSGFVVAGVKPKQILVRAVGPGVARTAGLVGTAATPRLILYDAAHTAVASNSGWTINSAETALAATAARLGAFPLSAEDADSALLVTLAPGLYSASVDAGSGIEGRCLVEAYDADESPDEGAKAVNVSTRGIVIGGQQPMIAGFVIGGNVSRRLLIRGAGPALNRYGIKGVSMPTLNLFNSSGVLVQQAGAWSSASAIDVIRDETKRAGAFAFDEGSADSAMIAELPPGIYSVVLNGPTGETGTALVEVYDLP